MWNRAVVMTASVGLVLCSAALSGCGGGTGAAEAPPASGAGQSQPVSGGAQSDPVPVPGEVVNGVAKDEATWSTPLAVYFGVDTNDLRLHAQSVVTATCMHENGYADFRENYDSTAPRPRTTAPDGVGRLFNEELAAQYGYRNAPNPQYLIEADVEAAGGGGLYENASPEFKDQWYACLDRATAEVNEVIDKVGSYLHQVPAQPVPHRHDRAAAAGGRGRVAPVHGATGDRRPARPALGGGEHAHARLTEGKMGLAPLGEALRR